MKQAYCKQCLLADSNPWLCSPFTWDASSSPAGTSQWIKCIDCGDTSVYPDGSCTGLCSISSHTPMLQRIKRAIWIRPIRMLRDAWYWFRCHTYTRYHMLDLRSPQNDYAWGWCDRDFLMLCACFNLLKLFVEKEDGARQAWLTWRATEEQFPESAEEIAQRKHVSDEITSLYQWWNMDRRLSFEKLNQDYSWETQEALREVDNANLLRLMAIREYLWT